MLFHWEKPSLLEDVLQPSGEIDWRLKPEYQLEAVRGQVDYVWSTWLPWSVNHSKPQELVDGTFAAVQSRLITISSNFLDQRYRGAHRGTCRCGVLGDGAEISSLCHDVDSSFLVDCLVACGF